jgi:uncharacterized membrane protein
MEIFWIIVTVVVVLVVVALALILGLRNHPLTRAEHADPDRARALREVQRQIDAGHSRGGL